MEQRMSTSYPPSSGTSHRTVADGARTALLVALLLANISALLVVFVATAPTAHAASPSLDIVVPRPASGVASGPVGANISISGSGTGSHAYQIGYATKAATCSPNIQPLSGVTATAGTDGAFSATFTWPTSGTTRGTSYYICAQDLAPLASALTPAIQSSQVYKVLTGDNETPSIALQAIPPVGATPPPTPPDGSYYAQSPVTISGSNFVPGHSTLAAYVTPGQTFAPSDTSFPQLAVQGGGTTFTSQTNGVFVVTVTLPLSPRGQVYLHVVSTDSTKAFPPALDASQQINLLPPQAATPTPPTVSTTPSPSTTAGQGSGGGGGNGSAPNPSNVLAVIGLSGLSIILFVIGIILMTSASAMISPQPRAPESRRY
jgi:hypothetical protein